MLRYFFQTIGSMTLGYTGNYLGSSFGIGPALLLGFLCSFIGWYAIKFFLSNH